MQQALSEVHQQQAWGELRRQLNFIDMLSSMHCSSTGAREDRGAGGEPAAANGHAPEAADRPVPTARVRVAAAAALGAAAVRGPGHGLRRRASHTYLPHMSRCRGSELGCPPEKRII